MACSYTDDELKRIAREKDGDEAERALEILRSRGAAPEWPFADAGAESAFRLEG